MATPRKDLKLIENDVAIENGDFKIVFSDEQHVIDTIASYPGWWKAWPLDGVAIKRFLGGPATDQTLIREIQVQLNSDGYDTTQSFITRDNRDQITIYPNATLRV